MKNLLVLLALTVTSLAHAAATTWTAHVTGMHCGNCAQKITAELEALPEVASAKVSFKTKSATVVTKDGQTLTAQKIQGAVQKAGYEADQVVQK